jgi:hypothetical protein
VVIIIWVMPCGPCILPSKTAYNIYKSYQTSHPGKVVYYLCDDLANNTCTEIQAWATTNKFFDVPVFSDPSISMYDYGGPGMPKIAIVAGSNHKVYNTQENTFDTQEILDAIDLAIDETSDIFEYTEVGFKCEFFYDASAGVNKISVTSSEPKNLKVEMLSYSGNHISTIFDGKIGSGENDFEISDKAYPAGLYLIRVKSDKNVVSKKIIII